LQECFKALGHKAGDFPVAEEAARRAVSLPIYPELSDGQQQFVADACADFVRQQR
jgi:dTDP-4-amino-4,6-dideoxygalactose transaminase